LSDELPTANRLRQDNGRDHTGSRLRDDLVMGLRFFSRLPTGDRPHEQPDLSRIARALPFTSLVIGVLPAFVLMGACWIGVPSLVAATLAVAALVVATGAMPEDALADAADGLFGGATIERRLEIMMDSRHGTYGVAALCLYLVLRVAGLGALAGINPLAAGGVWLASGVLARSGALWLSVDLPAAREGGASASAGRVTKRDFAIGAVFAAILSFVLAGPFVSVLGLLFGLLAVVGTAWGWTWLCRRLLGGQTGDVIGALHALIEVALLTVFLVFA
jgi:adenosylcobinamide-GDP ribazoletransferase